ncbi:MAG: TonB-dependent receptor [Terriglobia bacterium]
MEHVFRRSDCTRRVFSLADGARKAALLFSVFLLLLPVAMWAQDTATIVGTVTDSTGAVVPGAKVTVANPDRGFTRDVASDSAGEYTAVRIPIGNYVVSTEVAGFQKLVRSGIALSAGQTQKVDLVLTVGQVTQEIKVSGNVAKVETEGATLSGVVTSKQISNLALNGMNFLGLTFLVPGATISNSQEDAMTLGHSGAEISATFNGARTNYSQLEYDGGNNAQESSTSMGGAVTPALDSIAELKISTSNYGADVGQHAGALVEVVTKGGTKDFHGTAYENVRNDAMDANDFFANRQIDPAGGNAPKTPLNWNIFGYSLGGPFYIPGHYNTAKNKTFFFWSQEWARYRGGSTLTNAAVPTQRMRQGDFSECDPSSASYLGAVDPSFTYAGGCYLPSLNGGLSTVDTVTPVNNNTNDWLNAFVPLPNSGYNGYVHAADTPTNFSDTVIRVDQNFNDKASMFVRFSGDTWNNTTVPALWFGGTYDSTQSNYIVPARQSVAHLNLNLSPTLMNEFIISYTDTPHWVYPQAGPGSPDHSVTRPSDFDASHFFQANASNPSIPSVSIGGGTPFSFGEDNGPFLGKYDAEPIFSYRDNLAWIRGKHTLKVGFNLEKFQLNEQVVVWGDWAQGYFNFYNGHPGSTNNALADAFLGEIGNYTESTFNNHGVYTGGYAWEHNRRTDFDPYVQDDWKVNRRLTLNFGVRYYVLIPGHDVSNPTVDSSFLPNLYNPAAAAILEPNGLLQQNPATGQVNSFLSYGNGLMECGVAPMPKGCQQTPFGNFGPRFGFAWDPTGSGKTSIRGGYGIYYEPGAGIGALSLEGNPPTQLGPVVYNLTTYDFNTSGGFAGVGPGGAGTIPFHVKDPSIAQYNLDVQHEFKGNNLVTLAYVGNVGRHIDMPQNLNQVPVGVGMQTVPALAGNNQYCNASGVCDVQNVLMHNILPNTYFVPYQGYSGIQGNEPEANSSYNALQANWRHTAGHGLTVDVSYTYSHALDDNSGGGTTGVDDNYDLERWYSTSSLNRTQVLEANYVYDLPFFKNSRNAFAHQGLGGWRVSGITSFFSGMPQDFNCGIIGFNTGIGTSARCNTTGPVKVSKTTYDDPVYGPIERWFDLSNVALPTQSQLYANGQSGMFGYMGRNMLTGPGRNNWDLALFKEVALPWFRDEHSTLQFRLETFNTFNHVQWKTANAGCNGGYNNDGSLPWGRGCGDDTYNPGNGTVNAAWAPRQIQLGMKFLF